MPKRIKVMRFVYNPTDESLSATYIKGMDIYPFKVQGKHLYQLLYQAGYIRDYDYGLSIVKYDLPHLSVKNGSNKCISTIYFDKFMEENIGREETSVLIQTYNTINKICHKINLWQQLRSFFFKKPIV